MLARVETDLIKNCEDRYGFKWTKHANPLSPLRHMHITYLQSEGMKVAKKANYGTCWACQYETTIFVYIVKEYLKIKILKP